MCLNHSCACLIIPSTIPDCDSTIYLISVSDYDNNNNYICSTRPTAHNTNICYTTIMSDVICIDIVVGKGVCTYC